MYLRGFEHQNITEFAETQILDAADQNGGCERQHTSVQHRVIVSRVH